MGRGSSRGFSTIQYNTTVKRAAAFSSSAARFSTIQYNTTVKLHITRKRNT